MRQDIPPSQQQAEEAQQARHKAEAAALLLLASMGSGGGRGDEDSSTIEGIKIAAILATLSAGIISSSFRHPRNRSKSILNVTLDNKDIAERALPEAHRVFRRLKKSELNDQERAVSWATWAYSHTAEKIAEAIDLALADVPPEVNKGRLKKVWISRFDKRVRPLHAELHGKTVDTSEDFWRWPTTGQKLRWPGDIEAPLDSTIGCRCVCLLTWADQESVNTTIRRIVDKTKS